MLVFMISTGTALVYISKMKFNRNKSAKSAITGCLLRFTAANQATSSCQVVCRSTLLL